MNSDIHILIRNSQICSCLCTHGVRCILSTAISICSSLNKGANSRPASLNNFAENSKTVVALSSKWILSSQLFIARESSR